MRISLEAINLTKMYKKKEVIKQVKFRLKSGEIFALLGLNGAGKTTIIKMLTGLTQPTSGEIKYFNKPFNDHKDDMLLKIGSIVERPGFYEELSVFDNLKMITNIIGVHKADKIDEVLGNVGLLSLKDSKVFELTMAEKQRLAIGKALLNNPEILILDEPFNGLDPIAINDMRTLLLRLSKEKGVTLFISSHVLNEVEKLADKIAILHHGEIIKIFDIKEMKRMAAERIELKVADLDNASKILKSLKIKHEITSDITIVINTKHTLDDLLKLLVHKVEFYEIYPKKMDLETFFLNLIQESGLE